jgi:hypothetical protein
MPSRKAPEPVSNAKEAFAKRLAEAMTAAGYEPKPAVLEREFNTRHWGAKPMTLHGVRRWLLGQTMPGQDKIKTLADWLRVPIHELQFGANNRLESPRPPWDQGLGGYQDREIFETFLKLPVPQRKVVREVIMAFAQAQAAKKD